MVFFLSILLSSIFIWHLEQLRLQQYRTRVTNLAGDYGHDLKLQLNGTLKTVYVLAAQIQRGHDSVSDFKSLARALLPLYPTVQELVFVPNGVISSVVPKKGNEAALGIDIFQHPVQKVDAIKARDSGRLVLSGPVKLIQGGVALIGRLPVFFSTQFKGGVQVKKTRFWGLIEVLINLPALLDATDLQNLQQQGFNYELWYQDPKTGERKTIIATPRLPGKRAASSLLRQSYATWTLSVEPAQGWGNIPDLSMKITVSFFLSLLLAYALRQWMALRTHKLHLEHEVIARTSQIETTRQQLEATLNALPDLLIEYDLDTRILDYSSPNMNLLMTPENQMVGSLETERLPADAVNVIKSALQEAMTKGNSSGRQCRLNLPAGEKWFELSVARKPGKNGQEPSFIVLYRDVSAHKQAEANLQRLFDIYTALNSCHQDILKCATREELFSRVCHTVVQKTGIQMAWVGQIDDEDPGVIPVASYGVGVEYLQEVDISADSKQAAGQGPFGKAIMGKRPVWCQDFQKDLAGTPWHAAGVRFGWESVAVLPLSEMGKVFGAMVLYADSKNFFDEGVRNLLQEMAVAIGLALDRLQHEQAHLQDQEHIRQLAFFDNLTGLPNRELLEDRFRHSLSMARRNHKPLTVMFLDLDNFKNVNDSLGHHIGDLLLVELAMRLKTTVRQEDTIARQGGDEFILIFPDMGADSAAHFAEKLSKQISMPYHLAGHELVVMASIGIAIYPENGEDPDTLGRRADTAMYRAKREGRDTYRFFTQDMQQAAARVLELENALRHAMEHGQLFLCYQPQMDIFGKEITGVEVLLRWQHPDMGLVSPSEFIPVAESSGQILSIVACVLRHAVWQLKTWIDMGLKPITLAVNLSAMQFRDPNLVDTIEQVLEESALPPHLLELELTESVTMDDPEGAIAVMDRLNLQGVKMSIDDFGTGYSSLSYLKRFHATKLKIDQSFVRDIGRNSNDETIVSTIINLAKSLGLSSIAEGVETQQQLDFLRHLECDEIQGYFFSKPLVTDDFEQFLRDRTTL